MKSFVPVNEPLLDGNELSYLKECIETGWISSEGSFVERLEHDVAAQCGRRHAVAVCNGSAALELAMAAIDIGPGDEVILPSLTIISCAAAVVRAGATPVVVDSDAKTWNMDVNQIEDKISARTKAVLAVHTYGLPVDLDPLMTLCDRYDLTLVEDAAEAIGLRYKDRPCGGFGAVSVFSFYPNKHITTGEGGMVLTDDQELAERSRQLRNLCFGSQNRFVHERLGWNFRMSNLQAAVGVAQLENLDAHLSLKREIGQHYNHAFRELREVFLPVDQLPYAQNCYWVYGLVTNPDSDLSRDELTRKLAEKGVGTRPFFWPMHEQPVFRKSGMFDGVSCPNSEQLARNGFYIPSGLAMTRAQLEHVVEAVTSVVS